MYIGPSRLAAVVVAMIYAVVAGLVAKNGWAALWVGGVAFFPVSLIWFPEFWGQPSGRITRETPPGLVEVAGWVVLLGGPLALVLLNLLGVARVA